MYIEIASYRYRCIARQICKNKLWTSKGRKEYRSNWKKIKWASLFFLVLSIWNETIVFSSLKGVGSGGHHKHIEPHSGSLRLIPTSHNLLIYLMKMVCRISTQCPQGPVSWSDRIEVNERLTMRRRQNSFYNDGDEQHSSDSNGATPRSTKCHTSDNTAHRSRGWGKGYENVKPITAAKLRYRDTNRISYTSYIEIVI